ncbi:MAG: hypothetical protein JNK82_06595 [Myxococcaceae bacterium]|nr:hypothetical protein [Myxococcaceae bacterium]
MTLCALASVLFTVSAQVPTPPHAAPACMALPADVDDWRSAELLLVDARVIVGKRVTQLRYALTIAPSLLMPKGTTLTVTPMLNGVDAGFDLSKTPCSLDVSPVWACTADDGRPATFGSKLTCERREVARPITQPSNGPWVSENPRQPWLSLRGMWGAARDDAWAVGAAGTVVHYDGVRWATVDAGTTADFTAVAGASASDVWAVGDFGASMHFDGRRWEPRAPAGPVDLDQLVVSARGDVWAASSRSSELFHWQGDGWKRVDAPLRPSRLLAPAPGTLWVFDDSGACQTFDGRTWCAAPPPFEGRVLSSVQLSTRHIIAAGAGGGLARFDGELWWRERTGVTADVERLWAPQRDVAWAFGPGRQWARWAGGEWQTVIAPEGVNGVRAVWGAGADEGWVIDKRGAFYRYDGAAWSMVGAAAPAFQRIQTIAEVDGAVWAAGSGVMRQSGDVWSSVPQPKGPVRALAGSSAKDVWAVTFALQHDFTEDVATVWHYDGQQWEVDATAPKTVRVLWQRSSDELWAAGDLAAVWRRTARGWLEVDRGGPNARAAGKHRAHVISGDGAAGVWVAGNGPIKRCSASRCVSFESPLPGTPIFPIVTLTALSPTKAYAVSGHPDADTGSYEAADVVIAEWDGRRWKPLEAGILPMLYGHVAAGPRDLWLLGVGNTVVHLKDGRAERTVLRDVGKLTHISRSSDGVIRLLGVDARVLRWPP